MVELKVRLGPKGQIVIPKIFRNEFNLYPGHEVIIKDEETIGILIKRKSQDPIEILEKIAKEVSKRKKGRKIKIDPHDIYEQYEKRAKRAGL